MADQGAEGLLSPYLRSKRIQAVKPYLRGKILDFGCGSGELANLVNPFMYLGVEIDPLSLQKARIKHPDHVFLCEIPATDIYETIVSLAVIEHLEDPVNFLRSLERHLDKSPSARIIITTPHPSFNWLHGLGAKINIFSKHANEEHQDLLGRQRLEVIGENAGLIMKYYSRFLFGANQIVVYSRFQNEN